MNIRQRTSFAPSIHYKSDFKIKLSNIHDLQSSKNSLYIPPEINEDEIEIANENGKQFKSFLETPRTSGNYMQRLTLFYNSGNKNSNYNNNCINRSLCTQITSKMKNIIDIINYNTKKLKKLMKKLKN